jgi:rSAM/selenodomain-associated transferase 2
MVSVVVPVLNEARLAGELGQRLAGLVPRSGRTVETVIVDGGSDDGTPEKLRAAGLKVISAERGRARQMNAGARAAAGDVLLFLHADTRLPDGAAAAADNAVSSGAVGGCFRLRIDSNDLRLRAAARIISLRSRLMPSASGDQAIFVARDAFDAIGGYRGELCEDLDLVARLKKRGRFVCLDAHAETSARRWEKNGVGRTIALMWALRLGWHLGLPAQTLYRLYGQDVR